MAKMSHDGIDAGRTSARAVTDGGRWLALCQALGIEADGAPTHRSGYLVQLIAMLVRSRSIDRFIIICAPDSDERFSSVTPL